MDTDVEVINDFSKLLGENTVLGYEDDKNLTTAFIAVPPKSIWVKELLDLYEKRSFIKEDGLLDLTTNVIFISNYLKEKGLILNGKYLKKDDIEIYPSEYFFAAALARSNKFCSFSSCVPEAYQVPSTPMFSSYSPCLKVFVPSGVSLSYNSTFSSSNIS